ncbi:hypothetical protein [Paenibacillus sp. KN14-4R]|uniref:hypothetical protein n=1 Tax=Paenibacillus sp. KN14-4R TaxID=3445773 RepID=UPI003FA0CD4C
MNVLSGTVTSRAPVKDFKQLVKQLGEMVASLTTFEERVHAIVSFQYRSSEQEGLRSLTIWQNAALQVLRDCDAWIPFEQMRSDGHDLYLFVGMKVYGRIIMDTKLDRDEDDVIFGYVPIMLSQLSSIELLSSSRLVQYDEEIKQIDSFLSTTSADEHLEMIEKVRYMTNYTDPVLIYVEDQTYTRFSKHNNLVEETRDEEVLLFARLRTIPWTAWTDHEKVFIYCMYHLQQAGCRGEEFNGRQLNVGELTQYLEERRMQLSAKFDSNAEILAYTPITLLDKARWIGRLKAAVREDYVIYRQVNGLNFGKTEHLFPREEGSLDIHSLPDALVNDMERICGAPLTSYDPHGLYELFADWLNQILPDMTTSVSSDEYGAKLDPIENMVHTVVQYAVETIGADIGMSRGLREWFNLKMIHDDQLFVEACDWPVTDYYCCVVPSSKMQSKLADHGPLLQTILTAISKRMEYNSWHYMPGHFPIESRHFYIPPAMPDMTEWSNLHHSGHVLANVLYAIRSPGEIRYADHTYNGMMDIRLMRQTGDPFTLDDLKAAVQFTQVLKIFNQALMDVTAARQAPYRVMAFTKDWYKSVYGKRD